MRLVYIVLVWSPVSLVAAFLALMYRSMLPYRVLGRICNRRTGSALVVCLRLRRLTGILLPTIAHALKRRLGTLTDLTCRFPEEHRLHNVIGMCPCVPRCCDCNRLAVESDLYSDGSMYWMHKLKRIWMCYRCSYLAIGGLETDEECPK